MRKGQGSGVGNLAPYVDHVPSTLIAPKVRAFYDSEFETGEALEIDVLLKAVRRVGVWAYLTRTFRSHEESE